MSEPPVRPCTVCEHYYVEACKYDKPKLDRGIPCTFLCHCDLLRKCFPHLQCSDFKRRPPTQPIKIIYT